MTGIREQVVALGSDAHAVDSGIETAFLTLDPDASGGPNNSYELREMVVVASAYLGQGMLEDADELLREVLDAGYSRTDALDLRRQIDDARGDSIAFDEHEDACLAPEEHLPTIAFTSPLPGVDRLPLEVQRLIRESDADLRATRLHAAFDAALYVIGSAPDYYPMYVRLAEIQFATGRREAARTLTSSLIASLQDASNGYEWLVYPLRLALTDDDPGTLVQYARHLLDNPGFAPLDPYLPDAIAATLLSDPSTAQELARDYFKAMPLSDAALRLHIQASVASADKEALVNSITSNVRTDSAADLLILRAAIGASRSRSEWVEWLERATSQQPRLPADAIELDAALDLLSRMVPPARAHLTTAIIRLSGGRELESREAVARWRQATSAKQADRLDAFTAACADAIAADALEASDTLESLVTALASLRDTEVRAFADDCKLFASSARPAAILERIVAVAQIQGREDDAIDYLRELRDADPTSLDVREALATLCLRRERVADGVRELRYIAERRDAVGDVHGMVTAMRSISDALPNNVEVKAKISESFLQRGMLEDAMRELESLGVLLSERGKTADAVAAFTRGAEVAAAIGNFKRATEFLDHAVLAEPESDAVRHAAVAFFLRIGAVDRAVRQLWEVVRIAMTADDPDEAVAALHQIIALTPNDPAAFHKLGEVLASLGEYSQAEKVYRRLSVFTPDDPVLAAKQTALSVLASPK